MPFNFLSKFGFKRSLSCFVFSISLATMISSNPGEAAEQKGHFLYQTSGIIGDQNVFISENSIKIVDKSFDLITIARAPDWKVTTYHKKSRTICSLPLSSFNGYISQKEFDSTGQSWSDLPFVKSNTKDIAGLDATVFITPGSFVNKQLKDFDRQFADSKFIKSARYCVSNNLSINPKVRTILCKFYGLADKGGLPLEFKYHDLRGDMHIGLITSQTKINSSLDTRFDVPSGYKKVKNFEELLKIANSNKSKVKRRRPLL